MDPTKRDVEHSDQETGQVAFATEAVQDLRPLTRRATRVLDRLLASA